MANTRAATLRDLSDEAVVERLAETKAELFNLRFQHVTGQLDNTARLGELRKEVARINTELRSREIAAAEAQGQGPPPRQIAMGQGPPPRQIAQETTR